MRKLVVALLVLGALWLGVELAAVPMAEGQMEQRIAERNREAATVAADIDSFPLLTRLLATGLIRKATITLDRVARQEIAFAEIRFELDGIEVDRGAILRRDARITAIDRGVVTATIDAGAISEAVGRTVSLAGLDVRTEGSRLLVGPVSFALTSDVLPCNPEARVEGERIVVECTFEQVPQALLANAQR